MPLSFFGSHRVKSVKRYGWIPDHPDIHRPQYVKLCRDAVPITLPSSVDLRRTGLMPTPYDQGQIGSCTANAIAGAVQFVNRKERLADFMPSRLFIYYNERAMEGTIDQDAGAMIHDGVKSVAEVGVCDTIYWSYNNYLKTWMKRPTPQAYQMAAYHKDLQHMSIDNTDLAQMKSCLAAGYPIIMGFTVYDGFESAQVAQTGILDLPTSLEQIVGGHAILVIGYDDATRRFLVRNSWGADWGQGLTPSTRGYFTVPYEYFTDSNLADDAWTIRRVGKVA